MKLSAPRPNSLFRAIHIIVYGPPKGGKTELAGELAEHGFTLWFMDFENGSSTLTQSLSPAAQERVNIFRIPDTKDIPVGIETALRVVKPGLHHICDIHGKIGAKGTKCPVCTKNPTATFSEFDNTKLGPKDIVVFDSLTQISNSAMSHIGQDKDDTWKPEWEHFRSQGAMLDRFLSSIQNAAWHCICITHEMEIEQVNGADKIVPIAGTRNFSRNTAKYFDEVVYCQVRNKKHEAASSTTYSLGVLTGSRSRVAIEEQKDIETHLSLLPIFINQGISGLDKAENILSGIKTQIGAVKI